MFYSLKNSDSESPEMEINKQWSRLVKTTHKSHAESLFILYSFKKSATQASPMETPHTSANFLNNPETPQRPVPQAPPNTPESPLANYIQRPGTPPLTPPFR